MLRRLAAVFGATCAAACVWSGAALADETIGQTPTPTESCTGAICVQTGVAAGQSYIVPDGHWTVTGWSFQAGTFVGSTALVVLRPTGVADRYDVVGTSGAVTPVANSFRTYPASFDVEGGDLLGVWSDGGAVQASTGSPGDGYAVVSGVSSVPAVGSTQTVSLASTGMRLDISATLVPQATEQPGRTADHVFACYSKFERDGGDVRTVDAAAALLAAGNWPPVAMPGFEPGGDNIAVHLDVNTSVHFPRPGWAAFGAQPTVHLVCNPPPGAETASFYVSSGGQLLSPSDVFKLVKAQASTTNIRAVLLPGFPPTSDRVLSRLALLLGDYRIVFP